MVDGAVTGRVQPTFAARSSVIVGLGLVCLLLNAAFLLQPSRSRPQNLSCLVLNHTHSSNSASTTASGTASGTASAIASGSCQCNVSSSSSSSSSSSNVSSATAPASAPPPASDTGVKLFVGVLSRGTSLEARNAIRETWGTDKRLARLMFFALRPESNDTFRQLREEAATFGDLLVTSEVYEGYDNITYSVLDIFKAAAAMPPGSVTHVLKCDDDIYLRLDPLLGYLARLPRTWLYAGYPMLPGSVFRDPKGWHYVSPEEWGSDARVRYAFGPGYVLSIDLARHLAAGAPHMLMAPNRLLKIEDVAMGYWVEFVGKDMGVAINYDGQMRLDNYKTCSPASHVTQVVEKPHWKMVRCIFEHGGQCGPGCGFD